MKRNPSFSCVIGLLLWATFAAHAGRPMSTEERDIFSQGDYEWKSFGGRESSSDSPANLGWLHGHGSRCVSTFWALAAEVTLALGVEVMAEVCGDDRNRPSVGLSARWNLSDGFCWDASHAVQTKQPRIRARTLGFQLVF